MEDEGRRVGRPGREHCLQRTCVVCAQRKLQLHSYTCMCASFMHISKVVILETTVNSRTNKRTIKATNF